MALAMAVALTALAACTTTAPSPPIRDEALQAERLRMTQIALDGWDAETRRVYGVSQRLLSTALAKGWCTPARADRGVLVESGADLPPGLAAEVRAAAPKATGLRVVAVAANAVAAAAAGIVAGDLVLAVNGEPVSPANWPVAAWHAAQDVELRIADAQGERTVRLASQPTCAVDVVMDASHDLSAETAANGTIHVAQGMVQALQDDDSLALVIGHELGHRAHSDSALPRLLDASASQDQERQADLFGLRLLVEAGYDTRRVADVWDRLARLDPDRIGQNWLRDHPLRAERSLRLHEAIAATQAVKP